MSIPFGEPDYDPLEDLRGHERALYGQDTALRDRLLTLPRLAELPPARPLIDGLVYQGTVAQLSGPSGSYKSFIVCGMAVGVAAGVAFGEHQVTGAPVVYVAAEGASGLRTRIYASAERSKIDLDRLVERLYVLPEAVQLHHPHAIDELCELVAELDAGMVVIDTRAHCTHGLDENLPHLQAPAIAGANRLATTGAGVLIVHHTARGGTAGRGTNAWDAAVWSDLRLRAGGPRGDDQLRLGSQTEQVFSGRSTSWLKHWSTTSGGP